MIGRSAALLDFTTRIVHHKWQMIKKDTDIIPLCSLAQSETGICVWQGRRSTVGLAFRHYWVYVHI
jgi:hypothetical protein